MSIILRVVGILWAVLGVANIVGMFQNLSASEVSSIGAFGLIFNVVLFVIPGLALIGIGYRMEAKATPTPSDPAKRLADIEDLRDKGVISPEEYAQKREQIMREM